MNFSEEMKNYRTNSIEDYNQTVKEKIKSEIKQEPHSNSWKIDIPSSSHSKIKEFLEKEGFLVDDVPPSWGNSCLPNNYSRIRISFK
jgi:hypothetical protein